MDGQMFQRSHYDVVIMELSTKSYKSSLRKCTSVYNISSHLFIQMADSQRQFFKLVNENLAWIFISSRIIFNSWHECRNLKIQTTTTISPLNRSQQITSKWHYNINSHARTKEFPREWDWNPLYCLKLSLKGQESCELLPDAFPGDPAKIGQMMGCLQEHVRITTNFPPTIITDVKPSANNYHYRSPQSQKQIICWKRI